LKLPHTYQGSNPLLIVPTVRTTLLSGELFNTKASVFSQKPPTSVKLYFRKLGTAKWQIFPMQNSGRQVFERSISVSNNDFEWYISLQADNQTLNFPVTAPSIPQTVVVVTKNDLYY